MEEIGKGLGGGRSRKYVTHGRGSFVRRFCAAEETHGFREGGVGGRAGGGRTHLFLAISHLTIDHAYAYLSVLSRISINIQYISDKPSAPVVSKVLYSRGRDKERARGWEGKCRQ